MNSDTEPERRAEESLRRCLERVPFASIESVQLKPMLGDVRPDLVVTLQVPWGRQELVVDVKNNGQPRVARAAASQLYRYRDAFPGSYGVFAAPYISSKAAEICREAGIGYADFSGNCLLSFGTVYVEREGRPNLFREKRELRSLFAPKATRILRVLLDAPGTPWKVKDLATEARVSLGQVSNVLKLLRDREWVVAKREGTILSEPEQLLSEWTKNYTFRRNTQRTFYSLDTVADVELRIASTCRDQNWRYALAGFSAGARWAPAVRYRQVMAFVEEPMDDLVTALDLKRVESGANVVLMEPYDEGVFYGSTAVEGACVTSAIQTYLDLVNFRGRGEEAATAVLQRILRPRWLPDETTPPS